MKKIQIALITLGTLSPTLLPAQEAPAPMTRSYLEQAFLKGEFSLDLRLRYEFADQSGLDASHAATARTRLGYSTKPTLPLSGFIELENITALDSSAYNQAGLNNQPDKTIIADTETTELNQAYLRLRLKGIDAKLGRQRILLDDQRFVGNVGWRQNEQTFDAASVQYQPWTDLTLFYGYLDQINRIFGADHLLGRFDSDSHLFNARCALPFPGQGGAYSYLLRFDDAAAASADTYGLWIKPEIPFAPTPTTLHLEFATQRDNSDSIPGAEFSHNYFRAELETKIDRFTLGAGYERLPGDGTTAFQTPLATLHAFNGWADQFLATPNDGLEDIYLFAGAKLPAKLNSKMVLHDFSSTRGSTRYGREIDLLLVRPLSKNVTLLGKAAYFEGRSTRTDVTKFWIQAEIRL